MKAELACVARREQLPSSLFRHPAWVAWKETQGWRRVGALDGRPILVRALSPDCSMAYVAAPRLDGDSGDAGDVEYGARLEDLSRRTQAFLPADCAFIRWDLMDEAWKDARGEPLDARLLELRMNASTRHRRLRKAATEHMLPDTMIVDLRGGWPGVSVRMEHRARYSAQLASRMGTTVEKAGEEGLSDFHSLLRKTSMARGLRLYGEDAYRTFYKKAQEQDLSLELYHAKAAGLPVAAALIARHESEAWYLFAASDPEQRRFAGPSAILWQALRDCAEAGDERIDLCGVAPEGRPEHPLAGLSLFKAGFGGSRRSRAGAWDFVLNADVYEAFARAELVSLN